VPLTLCPASPAFDGYAADGTISAGLSDNFSRFFTRFSRFFVLYHPLFHPHLPTCADFVPLTLCLDSAAFDGYAAEDTISAGLSPDAVASLEECAKVCARFVCGLCAVFCAGFLCGLCAVCRPQPRRRRLAQSV
jgi:hypothetical protein